MAARCQGRTTTRLFLRTIIPVLAIALASSGMRSAPARAAQTNTWAPAAPLDKCTPPSPSCAGRTAHSATLLKNRKVLVVGGTYSPNTAQLYDPAKGSWSPAGPMKTGASLPVATLLPNGKVLVLGQGAPELYDPTRNTWTVTPPPRTGHTQGTATVLPNGKVLVAGGLGAERGTAAVDIYDPDTNTWETTGSLIQIRSQHTAALLPSGQVLVVGGFSENYGPKRRTAELFDPQKGTWAPTAEIAKGAVGHTLTVLPDGKVLLAGGQSEEAVSAAGAGERLAQIYDPGTGSWSPTADMASARSAHTATLLPDGKVLALGGVARIARRGAESPEEVTPAELYDPASGTWSPAARPGVVRAEHTATLLPEGPATACGINCGKLLVVGGRGPLGKDAETAVGAELYDSPPGQAVAEDPSEPAAASPPATKSAEDSSSAPLGVIIPVGAVLIGTSLLVIRRRRRARL